MVIELIQLLREREICHPNRVVSSTFEAGEVRLSLEGYPWWHGRTSNDVDRSIAFRFSGLTSGELPLMTLLNNGDDEALEHFDIRLTSELEWAQPAQSEIFCSMPLLRPLAVYMAVEDYIRKAWALRTPGDFLNGADNLRHFLEITASSGY
jgi:hypothetical protein